MTTQSEASEDLPSDLIDELLASYQKPEDLIGVNGFSSNSLKSW